MPPKTFAALLVVVLVAAALTVWLITSVAPAIAWPILGLCALGLTLVLRKRRS